jgi:hypothetical protein
MKIIAPLLVLLVLLSVGCKQKKPEAMDQMTQGNPHAGMDMKNPHAGMDMNNPNSGMNAEIPTNIPGGLDLDNLTSNLPSGWTKEAPTSSMRLAQISMASVAGDTAKAELVVYHFPGSGGSSMANIERWQNQYTGPKGEPGPSIAKTDTMMVGLLTVITTDVSGTQLASAAMGMGAAVDKPNYRMVASVIETPSGNWFIKVTGPAKTMAANAANIRSLIKKVKVKEGAAHP